MTKAELVIMWVAVGLIVLMSLVPPWQHDEQYYYGRFTGFPGDGGHRGGEKRRQETHFDGWRPWLWGDGASYWQPSTGFRYVAHLKDGDAPRRIDWARLGLQCGLVVLVATSVIVTVRFGRRQKGGRAGR